MRPTDVPTLVCFFFFSFYFAETSALFPGVLLKCKASSGISREACGPLVVEVRSFFGIVALDCFWCVTKIEWLTASLLSTLLRMWVCWLCLVLSFVGSLITSYRQVGKWGYFCIFRLAMRFVVVGPGQDVQGWGENDRGVSFTFGPDVVAKFLNRHDLDLICRAHQVPNFFWNMGFFWFFGGGSKNGWNLSFLYRCQVIRSPLMTHLLIGSVVVVNLKELRLYVLFYR